MAGAIALIVVTGLLTIFTIIFGELVPKQIGLAHAERVAMSSSRFIDVLGVVFGPLVGFLTWTTRRISRLFGADVAADERISAEELRLIIEQGGEQGILEAEEEQMIHAVIELGDQRVHEVMVPRIAMVSLAVERHDARRRSTRSSRRATAASRSTRRPSTRSSASSTPRTCCPSSRIRPASRRPCGRSCERRCSCPNR